MAASPETFTVSAPISRNTSIWPLVLEFHNFEDKPSVAHDSRRAGTQFSHGLFREATPNDTFPTQAVIADSRENIKMAMEVRVARTERKIRGTEGHFQHFHSSSGAILPCPPNLASQGWLQEPCDVYSHHIEGAGEAQLWVWLPNTTSWLAVEEGFVCPAGKVAGKILVLPEKFGVSWVGLKTLQRSYPHLLNKAVGMGPAPGEALHAGFTRSNGKGRING